MSTHLATQVALNPLLPTPDASLRPHEGNVRIYRAMVQAGQMSEEEATAILGKSPFAAQGKIEALLPTPNAAKAGNDVTLTCSGDGRQTPNKLGWAVAESLLPTPRAIYGEHPGMTDPKHLTGAAMLPTPRHEGFDAGAHRGKPDSLHALVKMLPTPTAHDHKDTGAPSERERNSPALATHANAQNAATGMKLNPDWVARMMGYPDGWLDFPITNEELVGGRVLRDWAFLEDGTRVKVYKEPGGEWTRVSRTRMRAGKATR